MSLRSSTSRQSGCTPEKVHVVSRRLLADDFGPVVDEDVPNRAVEVFPQVADEVLRQEPALAAVRRRDEVVRVEIGERRHREQPEVERRACREASSE